VNALLTAAAATSNPGLDGLQAPWPYSPLIALGLFVGLPLVIIGVIVLAVYGASWTRSGRTTSDATGQATWMSSPAASMSAPDAPGGQLPAGSTDASTDQGGTSARW
jgi:hypothetical protein